MHNNNRLRSDHQSRVLAVNYIVCSPLSFPAKNVFATGTFTAREVLGQTSGMDHSYIDCGVLPPTGRTTPSPEHMYCHMHACIVLSFFYFQTNFQAYITVCHVPKKSVTSYAF